MPKRIEIKREYVEHEYYVEGKTLRQIARQLGLKTPKAIFRRVKEWDLKLRPKRLELFKRVFGSLIVEKFAGHTEDKCSCLWICKCECGKLITVTSSNLLNKSTRSCGCKTSEFISKSNTKHQNFGEIPGSSWANMVNGAELRNLEVSITIEDMNNQFIKQKGKCALTGQTIHFGHKNTKKLKTASLDRIDSGRGYTKDNIQWVHKDINRCKQNFSEDYLLEMCRMMITYNEIKKNEKTLTDDIYLACNG